MTLYKRVRCGSCLLNKLVFVAEMSSFSGSVDPTGNLRNCHGHHLYKVMVMRASLVVRLSNFLKKLSVKAETGFGIPKSNHIFSLTKLKKKSVGGPKNAVPRPTLLANRHNSLHTHKHGISCVVFLVMLTIRWYHLTNLALTVLRLLRY